MFAKCSFGGPKQEIAYSGQPERTYFKTVYGVTTEHSKATPATAGFAEQRFHCSFFVRNKKLTISGTLLK